MAKEPVPDYTGFPITKLPPGRALGADSLTVWALRRADGGSGSADGDGKVDRRWICKKCKKPNLVHVASPIRFLDDRRCRHCKKFNGRVFLHQLKHK